MNQQYDEASAELLANLPMKPDRDDAAACNVAKPFLRGKTMSLDEQYERELFDALEKVAKMPWPAQRERIFRAAVTGVMNVMNWKSVELMPGGINTAVRACRKCGCTDHDCKQCIERTGGPCHWVEADLCSACEGK